MEHVPCALCATSDTDPVVTARNYLRPLSGPLATTFHVVRCRRCGLMYVNPRPTEDEIGAYYAGYSLHKPGDVVAPPPMADDGRTRTRYPEWLRGLAGLRGYGLPRLPQGARVLEVGCATGSRLAALRSMGWELTGVEPSPEAADIARREHRLEVFTGTVENMPRRSCYFDLVYAWHVVEHLAYPLRTLRLVHEAMKPGARLFVSLPNAGAFERRVFGRYWAAWEIPIHYYSYTPATIRRVLEAAGFVVDDIQFDRGIANVVQSVGCVLRAGGWFPQAQTWLTGFGEGVAGERTVSRITRPLGVLAAACRQGGRMMVAASKPSA